MNLKKFFKKITETAHHSPTYLPDKLGEIGCGLYSGIGKVKSIEEIPSGARLVIQGKQTAEIKIEWEKFNDCYLIKIRETNRKPPPYA